MTDHREEAIRLMWALDWTFLEALEFLEGIEHTLAGAAAQEREPARNKDTIPWDE